MITESSGIWTARARLAYWDEPGNGVVTLIRRGEPALADRTSSKKIGRLSYGRS